MKKVSVMALVLAVVLLLTACQSGEYPHLSQKKQQEIQDAYLAYNGLAFEWYQGDMAKYNAQYIGTFSDSEVFLASPCFREPGSGRTVTVAGYEFSGDGEFVYAVRDGKYKKLAAAYNNGWVSEEAVGQIWRIIDSGKYSTPSQEVKTQIHDCFCNDMNYQLQWQGSDETTGRTKYFGTYSGYDVFFDEGGPNKLTQTGREVIGDYIFQHGYAFDLFAYKDGKLTLLADAYGAGEISDEDLEQIFDMHLKYRLKQYPNWTEGS